MRFLPSRTLRMALRALRRNVLCSVLTTLGIVIGVAAVIAMMEIGQGSAESVRQTITRMGASVLLVQPGSAATGSVRTGAGGAVTLTPQDAEAIRRECPAVTGVAMYVRTRTQVVYGNRNWVPMYIYGTTPAFLDVRDWQDLEEGEPFTDLDVQTRSRVCLLGQTLVRELFQGESPLGKEVRLQNVTLKVVGVLRAKGANLMGYDQDDILLAPLTTIKNRVSGTSVADINQSAASPIDTAQRVNSLNQLYPDSQETLGLFPLESPSQLADTPNPVHFANVDRILVRAESTEEIPEAMEEITDLLHERHHIRAGEPDDFNIRDTTETTRALGKTTYLMAGLLLCVALISLVVGGVGIMNIMLVSVTERTREIGLRMAVGARGRDILRQFMAEAVLLCLLGGVAGIGLGRGCSLLVRLALHWPTAPSVWAMAAAVTVSATVGLVFGYYPAWKASRLDPIVALRHE
jgi:ABC-type antimicrobial peptide transport system permease subunit